MDDWRGMARTWARHERRPSAAHPLPAEKGASPSVEEVMEACKVDRDVARDMLDMGLY